MSDIVIIIVAIFPNCGHSNPTFILLQVILKWTSLFRGVLWVPYSHPQIKHISSRVMLGRLDCLAVLGQQGFAAGSPGRGHPGRGTASAKAQELEGTWEFGCARWGGSSCPYSSCPYFTNGIVEAQVREVMCQRTGVGTSLIPPDSQSCVPPS